METIKKYGRSTFSSLQIPNFKLYFIGQIISSSGTWMQNIAQGLLLLQLTGSGTALGVLIALQFVPILFFGSFGGVLADRYSKRKILFITQSSAGVLALILGALIHFKVVEVWMVYAQALALGFVTALDNPTRQTFIFEMVGKEHIKNAVSLNSVMVSLARVIGPSLAGVTALVFGLAACFFINGLSYIAVLLVLAKMNPKEIHKTKQVTELQGQFIHGLRYVKDTPALRNILLMMFIMGTLTYEFMVILPLFAQFTFHNATVGYAILTTAMGFGSILGGLYAANRKKTSMTALISIAFIFGVTMLIAALAPSLITAAIAMVLVGMFSINFNSLSNSMLQLRSLPEMRGRVMSLWSTAFLGTTPIGGPIIGWIGEHIGPRWGMAVGGFAALFAAIFVYFLMKRDEEHTITPEVEMAKDHAMSDGHMNMR